MTNGSGSVRCSGVRAGLAECLSGMIVAVDGLDRPLLFLDVDGVVNVLGAVGEVERWSFPDGRLLVTPTGIARRLGVLAEGFDVVWATTWGTGAPEVLGHLLGVGSDWPVLDFDDLKWPAIQEQAGVRRFAWIDDNAAADVPTWQRPSDVAFVLADGGSVNGFAPGDVTAGPLRGLVVVADPRTGLDAAAGELLRRFAGASMDAPG